MTVPIELLAFIAVVTCISGLVYVAIDARIRALEARLDKLEDKRKRDEAKD